MRDKDPAIERFDRAYRNLPSEAARKRLMDNIYLQAVQHLKHNRKSEALGYFEQLRRIDPENVKAAIAVAGLRTDLSLKNKQQMIQSAQPDPQWSVARDIAMLILSEKSERMSIGTALEQLHHDRSQAPWILMIAGDIYWLSGDLSQMAVAYEHALSVDSGNPYVKMRLGLYHYLETGDRDQGCGFLIAAADRQVFPPKPIDIDQLCKIRHGQKNIESI